METELDENPIDIPPSTTTSTGSQKPKPKINVSKWDPENIDENIPQVKKKKKSSRFV